MSFNCDVALQNLLSNSVISASISWQNINVYSKAESGCWSKEEPITHIIKNVSGAVRAGQTLAIMGSSGAGKTTLLNVLTARNLSHFQVNGVVKINGQLADINTIISTSAYVQQDDLFLPTLTVREHLVFQAMVRMDQSISEDFKIKRIEEVIRELGLEKCADTRVGGMATFKGISGGEMKRLAFAAEILTNPSIMFCDEPTSGLDSFMAANLVRIINKMAAAGRTIICTIHQPSSEVFHLFQNLLLMADGRVAYMGPLANALDYFSELGLECPPNYNPADFYVQELAIAPGKEGECRAKVHRICDYHDNSMQQVENQQRQSSFVRKKEVPSRYKASMMQQYQALMWRSYLTTVREPLLTYVRLGQSLLVAIILGLIYFHQHYDQRGMMNINGALFLLVVNLTTSNTFAVVNVFCSELSIFLREHNNGMYQVDAYFVSKNLAELPIFIFIPILIVSIYYYMVGFNPAYDAFLYTMIIGILISVCGISFGYMSSCLCGDTDMALSLGPPILLPLQMLGGFFLNTKSIPSFFIWAKYLSWFHYGFELLIRNQWESVRYLDCDASEQTSSVTPESGLTSSLYELRRNEPKTHGMCLPNGPEVIEFLDLGHDSRWLDIIAIIFICLILRSVAYTALYLRAKNR